MYPDLKVLLVDDNASNRLIGSKLLMAKCQIDPDIAEDGEIAIERLLAKQYDLVFMDCMMPVMDGYEATRRIRAGAAGEASKDVIIVAMTGNISESDREDCLAAGMSDYMSKPMRPGNLMDMIERWVKA